MSDRAGGRSPVHSPASFPPEWRLLLSCAREAAGTWGARPVGDPRPDPAGPEVDWTRLIDLADRHGLTVFLHRFLERLPDGQLPPPVRERLGARVRVHSRDNLRLTSELITLVRAFREEGVEVLAYKGPVLSQRLYGDPALRDYDDLDLLVRPTDTEKATRILKERGFEPWFELSSHEERRLAESQYARHFGDVERRVAVDLHWGFAQPFLSSSIDEATTWGETDPTKVGGTEIRTLPDELLLLVLCVHGSKHEPYPWPRLKWILDVAALARRIPPDRWKPLLERARELHLERAVLFGLLMPHRLLGAELAPPVRHRATRLGGLDRLVDAAVETLLDPDRPPPLSRLQYDLRLLDRRRDRARYLLHRAFVPNPKDWNAVRLPTWLAPVYYLVRPFRLVRVLITGSRQR